MSPRSDSMFHYFSLTVNLFHEYKWVYDFKATDILSEEVMGSIPLGFQDFFRGLQETDGQFHELLNLQENGHWPEVIRRFVTDSKELIRLSNGLKCLNAEEYARSASEQCTVPEDLAKLKLPRKWNPKKYFEVVHVGNFVGRIGNQEGCDVVVDIGSGLGYLSGHLASQFKIPVIGLESEASRVQTARNIYSASQSNSDSCGGSQTYECLQITGNMSEELEPLISNYSQVCLTALHACGDLTPWSLKHFVGSRSCKMVAVVPCCYHKMDKVAGNFPISKSLNSVLEKYGEIGFLQSQWLWRLASQRAGAKFLNDIRKETRNLFYRAILERCILQENLLLIKKRRNAYDTTYEIFPEYLAKTVGEFGAFELLRDGNRVSDEELKNIMHQMKDLHDELNSWSRVITGVLALQGAIQIIAEELILLDRLCFMEESGLVKAAGVLRVIPEDVSPRGMVLFGIKR